MTVIYELGSLHGCVEIEVFYVKITFGRYDTVEVHFARHYLHCGSGYALPKVDVDFTPVGIDGSVGVKALAVAPVSLTADGMLPLRTPDLVFFFFLVCCRFQCALALVLTIVGGLVMLVALSKDCRTNQQKPKL